LRCSAFQPHLFAAPAALETAASDIRLLFVSVLLLPVAVVDSAGPSLFEKKPRVRDAACDFVDPLMEGVGEPLVLVSPFTLLVDDAVPRPTKPTHMVLCGGTAAERQGKARAADRRGHMGITTFVQCSLLLCKFAGGRCRLGERMYAITRSHLQLFDLLGTGIAAGTGRGQEQVYSHVFFSPLPKLGELRMTAVVAVADCYLVV